MRIILATAALVLLAACGGGSDGPTGASGLGDLPKCSTVWMVGESIPKGYDGCLQGDSALGSLEWDCKVGEKLQLVELKSAAFFTAADGSVAKAELDYAEDPIFVKRLDECNNGAETKASSVACSDLWAPGKTLPSDYTACKADAKWSPFNDQGKCHDGRRIYGVEPAGGGDEMWATPGKTIVTEADEDAYGKWYDGCLA